MRYTTPEMAEIFSRERHIRGLLAFEEALAVAEGEAGVIPEDAAQVIAETCRTGEIDIDALYESANPASAMSVPVVRWLTAQAGPEAGAYVHWGATTQDLLDTGQMLQTRDGLDLLAGRLRGICEICAQLADTHRATPMIGRTLNVQALPITFGLKAARWLAMLTRNLAAIERIRDHGLALQYGGAVGTLAPLGDKGPDVQRRMAEYLGLGLPELPWHTERDRILEISSAVGIVASSVQKIAGDLALMVQTEVGEVAEPVNPAKGGSSTMPHKRNPTEIVGSLAASRMAIGMIPILFSAASHEHERAAGAWQAEWEAYPALFQHTDFALVRLDAALDGVQVDSDRMMANLEMTNGVVMAESLTMKLAESIGRLNAYQVVKEVCNRAMDEGMPLLDACNQDPRVRTALSDEEIAGALDPLAYLGSANVFIDNALKAYRDRRPAE
jgi:3-carboxy-cis,cis-muconate cycloisomerase